MSDEEDRIAARLYAGLSGTAAKAEPRYKTVDKDALFAGGLKVQLAEVLFRRDGVMLFYRGTVNSIIGESESGKTWMALLAAKQMIVDKEKVLVIDYEDTPTQVILRLMAMGVTQAQIIEYFDYISPEGPFGEAEQNDFENELGIKEYGLVIIDGVTEAMSMHGLNGREENDIAKFYDLLPKWISERGPCVLLIDHVTKAKEGRGTYAIGSQHKKAGITGASYMVDRKDPMGRGKHGRSSITLAKDKLGGIPHDGGTSGSRWCGTLHVKADTSGENVEAWIDTVAMKVITAGLTPALVHAKEYDLRRAVTDTARKHSPFSSKTNLFNVHGGKKESVLPAVDYLEKHGYLRYVGGTRKMEWVKDYDGSELSDD